MKTTLLFPFFFFFLFVIKNTNGQNYHLLLDKNFTSLTAAETLTSLNQAIYKMEERLIPTSIGNKNKSKWRQQFSNKVFRLTKAFFWDLAISGTIVEVQHEMFGFGYRYRQFGYTENSYHIQAPFPYKNGGGFTDRGLRQSGRTNGKHETIMMETAGYESTKILSNTINKKWILSDSIHYKEALLSIRAFNKSQRATLLLKNPSSTVLSIDIINYLNRVNSFYGANSSSIFNRSYLRKRSLINFLNPFLGFAFLSAIESYGWEGKRYGKLHWLKIGKIKYLPSFRIGLAPFGDEVYFESFLKTASATNPQKMKAARIYIRRGNPIFEKHNGMGIETFNYFNHHNKLIVDFSIDGWNQPRINLGGEQIYDTQRGFGGLIKFNLQIRLWESPKPVYISTQLGLKSAGYLEGESLSKGMIFRVGWSYDM